MSNPPRPIDRILAWTGERCVPWIEEWQVLYEHLHRYFFAADMADGKRVLDLGSGEGYGSAILAERAKHVVGVDVDARAVQHASTNYVLDNLEFRQGSVPGLDDLADGSFELVVCFEVIEHIAQHEELLSLVRRVLAPDGLFLVSTPDREVYSEQARYQNPFHIKELSREEFDDLLGRYFSNHDLWVQSAMIGSTLQRIDSTPDGPREEIYVRRDGDRWQRHQVEPITYMVAVASQFPLPTLPEFSLLKDREAKELTTPLHIEIGRLERQIAYTEQSRTWRAIVWYRALRAALSRQMHPSGGSEHTSSDHTSSDHTSSDHTSSDHTSG